MIERFGIVEAVEQNRMCVKLFPESQCASCRTCTTGKPVWFENVRTSEPIMNGDHVLCAYESSEAGLALGIFIVPPIIFFVVFLVSNHFFLKDVYSGGLALLVCIVYVTFFAARVRKNGRERIVTIRKVSHE